MTVAINKLTPVNIKERKALDIKSGDTIRVWFKIKEEKTSTKANKKAEKTIKFRSQAFEGMVLAIKHGKEIGATITVRKVSQGVGVERIFPLYSPLVEKIEIIKKAKARRAKLYYVRDKAVKEIRRKMKATMVLQNGKTDVEEEIDLDNEPADAESSGEAKEKAIEIIETETENKEN